MNLSYGWLNQNSNYSTTGWTCIRIKKTGLSCNDLEEQKGRRKLKPLGSVISASGWIEEWASPQRDQLESQWFTPNNLLQFLCLFFFAASTNQFHFHPWFIVITTIQIKIKALNRIMGTDSNGWNRARGLAVKALLLIGGALLVKRLRKSTTRWDHARLVAQSLAGEKVSISFYSFSLFLSFLFFNNSLCSIPKTKLLETLIIISILGIFLTLILCFLSFVFPCFISLNFLSTLKLC